MVCVCTGSSFYDSFIITYLKFIIFNNQPAVDVCAIVLHRSKGKQHQTRSCHSLHFQTTACFCAVSGAVLEDVM